MRRSEALIPLSHDHHHALVTAKRINELCKQAEAEIQEYWAAKREVILGDMKPHFDIEEASLIPLLKDNGPDLYARLVSDHEQMTELLENPNFSSAIQFADLLKQHVRFEERELFPWLESQYSQQFLANIMRNSS